MDFDYDYCVFSIDTTVKVHIFNTNISFLLDMANDGERLFCLGIVH